MNQQTIDNKLIAEFMGGKLHKALHADHSFYTAPDKMPIIPKDFFVVGELKYHKDWNWLMPVAHKCLTICRDKMKTEWESVFSDIFLTCSIESMQKEIVEFINWYNKQRK